MPVTQVMGWDGSPLPGAFVWPETPDSRDARMARAEQYREKLRTRYPEGFSTERSMNRENEK